MPGSNGNSPRVVVTSPDPSDHTVAVLSHEILMMKELFGERFLGQERAVTLLQARADKAPSIEVVNQDLQSLCQVMKERFTTMGEKFATIQIQFSDRDIALAAALAAAEKAVGVQNNNNLVANTKQEQAIAKQIDGIGELLATTTKGFDDKIAGVISLLATTTRGFDDKIDGLKERISATERMANGTRGEAKGLADGWGYLVGLIGAIAAIAAVIALVLKS